MASTSQYNENLKQDTTELILSLDSSTKKIQELSNKINIEDLKKVAYKILDELQSKYPNLLNSLPVISKDKFNLVTTLKFIYIAVPLLSRQREIDSSVIFVSNQLNELSDSVVAGESSLKKFELSHCAKCLSKAEKIRENLNHDFKQVYMQSKKVEKVIEQMKNYKEHLKEIIFTSIQQIVVFSKTVIEINDEFDPKKVNELANFLGNLKLYIALIRTELCKGLKEFLEYYMKNFGAAGTEVTNKGIKQFYIVKRKEKPTKTGQDLALLITPEYFTFIEAFIKFIENSRHLVKLQLGELLIVTGIDELLNYWINNFITPNEYQFTQNIFDQIYERFNEFYENSSISYIKT